MLVTCAACHGARLGPKGVGSAAAREPDSAPRTAAADPGTGSATLACRVVDSGGHPIEGATVEFVHVLTSLIKSHSEYGPYLQLGKKVHDALERTVASGMTDENGEVTSVLPCGRPFEVRVRHAGWVSPIATNRQAGERVQVVMTRPGAIAGVCSESVGGGPITTGAVSLSRREGWFWMDVCTATISADGSYRADGLLPGWYTARAEWTESPSDGVAVIEGGTRIVNLSVKPPSGAHPPPSDSTRGQDGPGRLAPGRIVRGRLVTPDGQPASGAYVAAVHRSFHVDAGTFELRETRSHVDGSFELTDLDRRFRHTLCAWTIDQAPLFFDLPAEERSRDEWDVGALTFVPAATLSGTVVASDGAALPGVRVTLLGRSLPQAGPLRNGADGEYDPFRDRRSLHTDESSRFVLIDLSPGRYVLTFEAEQACNVFEMGVVIDAGATHSLGAIPMPDDFLARH